MGGVWRRLLPLLGAFSVLFAVGGSGSASHSLYFFDMVVSEPGPGLPQFIIMGYVDDQPIDHYDSITKRDTPQVSWMEEYGKDNPKFWEMETQKSQHWEYVFRENLMTLRNLYNQKNSTVLHTWQRMYGCEVGLDGQLRGGHSQYAYDGEDFIALDRETFTWTASMPQALVIKRRWEEKLHEAQRWKSYLKEECVEWLRSFLVYGKEILQRTEAPMARVSRKKGYDGLETLFCQLYGFYPKEIEVTWMKDGEDRKPETYTGGVVPNSDGTYHTWLSIEVDPKERDRYHCRVEHDSLLEPLDLAWEEPASNLGLIMGIAGGVLLAVAALVGAGVTFSMKKQQQGDGYATASTNDPGPNSASRGSSSHSLRYFYMALSEPSQGLPQFVVVGYVDDQLFIKYDSHTRKILPKVSWMEKVGNEDLQYWERNIQKVQVDELLFRRNLVTLRERYKQQNSTGLHTLQEMYGCKVGSDRRFRGGHFQFAYDGEDFLAFDGETVTWTAPAPQARQTQRRWEKEPLNTERRKSYLEKECVEWLGRYLNYSEETLQRTERPIMRVSRKKGYDGQETLFCQLYGFYPKEIEVTWMKDGEDQKPETLTGGVVPNSDGTYHTWLSIEVDPKERDRYRCRVGHDSLLEPLDLAWEEPASKLPLIVGVVVGVLVAVLLGAGVAFYMKKRSWPESGYKATLGSDQGSDSSTRGSDQGSDASTRVAVPEAL